MIENETAIEKETVIETEIENEIKTVIEKEIEIRDIIESMIDGHTVKNDILGKCKFQLILFVLIYNIIYIKI